MSFLNCQGASPPCFLLGYARPPYKAKTLMASSTLPTVTTFPSLLSPTLSLLSQHPTLFPLRSQPHHHHHHHHHYHPLSHIITLPKKKTMHKSPRASGSSVEDALGGAVALIQSSPATWQSALLSNILIFVVGSPILVAGLSLAGIGAAFLLGTLTWRAFGPSGFLLVATYFVIVSINFLPLCLCTLLACF